ncbi:MAG: hypothetical protein NZM07_11335 [Elioraea sp.]|nr:hypothetical protein [Elioraea sp.]MCX8004307.1 hypothetical protein [Burkholderiaceae bacterium]
MRLPRSSSGAADFSWRPEDRLRKVMVVARLRARFTGAVDGNGSSAFEI